MNRRRTLGIVLTLAGALVLTMGTFGLSAGSGDRGASAAVVDDSAAYVDYRTEDVSVDSGGGDEALLTVHNQHTQPFDVVEVALDSDSDDALAIALDEPRAFDVPVGGQYTFTADVSCEDAEDTVDATVTLTVDVEADSAAAAIEGDTTQRRFEVECTPAPPDVAGVDFLGAGNAEIVGGDGTITAQVWVAERNGDALVPVTADFEMNEKVRSQVNQEVGFNFNIAAVQVTPVGTSYIHPQWNGESLEQANQGGPGCVKHELIDSSDMDSVLEDCTPYDKD